MMEGGDKARAEFLSEAQELVETLSRNLLSLEQGRAGGGRVDPEHLNEAFRSVHTLKSLSGLFGDKHMSQLSHRLEDVLDDLRGVRHRLGQRPGDFVGRTIALRGRGGAQVALDPGVEAKHRQTGRSQRENGWLWPPRQRRL